MPEKCITITKVQVGHVIGPGGSTIKSIQQETGAKLEIVEGPQVKITAEEQSQVDAAEVAVQKIVANQENPDYEGPEGARLRKEANALGDKRSKLYDEATAKRNAGDYETANKLVEEAKQAGEEMQARNHDAAAAIAKYNNEDKGKGEDYFDMHGLREEEAMDMLKIRVATLESKPTGTVTDFEVIPGAGHHSAPGAQKLKGATEAYLKEKGLEYEAISAGSFKVKIPGKGEGEPPAKKPKAEGEGIAKNEEEKTPADNKKEAPKDEKKDAPKDEKRDAPKDEKKDAPKDEKKEAPKNEKKEAPKDSDKKVEPQPAKGGEKAEKSKPAGDSKEKKDESKQPEKKDAPAKQKKQKSKKCCCAVM